MNTSFLSGVGRTARAMFTAAMFTLAACGGAPQNCTDCGSRTAQELAACDPNAGCGLDYSASTVVKFHNAFANVVHISGTYSLEDPVQSGSLANDVAVEPGATITLTTLRTVSGSMNLQMNVIEPSYGGAIGFTPVALNNQCVAIYYGTGASPAFEWVCSAL